MYFNPYEKKENRRKRYLSNILIGFVIITFFIGVFAIIFRKNTVDPFVFDQIKLPAVSADSDFDKSNEFRTMMAYLQSDEAVMLKNSDFDSRFPTAAAMLSMDASVYNEHVPYIDYSGEYIVISQIYNDRRADYRTMDVELLMISPLSVQTSGEKSGLELRISDISRFSVNYNTRSGELSYLAYNPSSFRLTVDTITVHIKSNGRPVESAGYTLNLKGANDEDSIKKLGLNKSVMDAVNSDYHVPKITVGESRTSLTLEQDGADFAESDEAAYRLIFSEDLIVIFSDMTIAAEFSGESVPEFSFDIN